MLRKITQEIMEGQLDFDLNKLRLTKAEEEVLVLHEEIS